MMVKSGVENFILKIRGPSDDGLIVKCAMIEKGIFNSNIFPQNSPQISHKVTSKNMFYKHFMYGKRAGEHGE